MKQKSIFIVSSIVVFAVLTWYSTTIKAQPIRDELAGHWSFDKKDTDAKITKDALGEHNGEIKGTPQIVEGKIGEALSFNGQDEYVVMGAITEGQDLSYAMWIKVDMIPKNTQVIIWDDDPNGGGDSWLELMSDGTIQTQRGGDGFGVFRSKTLVKPQEWTHIAFVANEKKDKKILYINGMSDAEASGKITTRTNRSHIVVAVGHDRNSFIKPNYFEGVIDDVTIYNRALSSYEVIAVMNGVLTSSIAVIIQQIPAQTLGESFPLKVKAVTPTRLHDFTFTFIFDPQILKATSVDYGSLLNHEGADPTTCSTPIVDKTDTSERVASGTYFYRLKTEGYVSTQKMVILQ